MLVASGLLRFAAVVGIVYLDLARLAIHLELRSPALAAILPHRVQTFLQQDLVLVRQIGEHLLPLQLLGLRLGNLCAGQHLSILLELAALSA
mgnify:CR=1 FL=1